VQGRRRRRWKKNEKKKRKTYILLVENSEGRRLLGRPRDDIKMDLGETS
jgi:hypothetical protein